VIDSQREERTGEEGIWRQRDMEIYKISFVL
jgi:hypothetical protein